MNKQTRQLMIYGANGYTGQLIVDEALKRGLSPVIAGRNREALEAMGAEKQLEARVFTLDSIEQVSAQLQDIDVLIHCAGPFSATAEPMMRACIKSHTHYTDITGEIDVFELAQSLTEQAKEAGIVLCPGVGFDVIPTDCLASQLKQKMPDATHLTLGFDSGSSMSPGTAKTSVEGLGKGGKIRKDGQIITVPLAYKCRQIDFGRGEKNAVTIPWGDVSTAYYSTGIPNIEVYIPISPRGAKGMRRLNWIRWVLGLKAVQRFMKNKIGRSAKGPDESQREQLTTFVWGEVSNAIGDTICASMQTANGYLLTYLGAVEVASFLLGDHDKSGAFTPSLLIDNQLVNRLAGTSEAKFS